MTSGGHAYELVTPKSAPRTRGTAGSQLVIPLLKTPTSQLGVNGGPQPPEKRKEGGHGPTLEDEVVFLLPLWPETE
jgi:DNA (cytosine-5)-methyltransferase 1